MRAIYAFLDISEPLEAHLGRKTKYEGLIVDWSTVFDFSADGGFYFALVKDNDDGLIYVDCFEIEFDATPYALVREHLSPRDQDLSPSNVNIDPVFRWEEAFSKLSIYPDQEISRAASKLGIGDSPAGNLAISLCHLLGVLDPEFTYHNQEKDVSRCQAALDKYLPEAGKNFRQLISHSVSDVNKTQDESINRLNKLLNS